MSKPEKEVRKERNNSICKKVKAGYTYREVSKMYRITRQRVHQIFREHYPQPGR